MVDSKYICLQRTVSVTLFGKGVFVDVIKIILDEPWWLSIQWSVLITEEKTCRRGEGHAKEEVEITVELPQAQAWKGQGRILP